MKNIHVLPTDKLSRLRYNLSNVLVFTKEFCRDYGKQVNQNIYITSDEEIKDKCYVLCSASIGALYLDGVINTASMLAEGEWKKIILTDNEDLIKDGVQAIDDEFLEWFVENPNCEWVVVEKKMLCDYCGEENCDNFRCRGYIDSVWYEIIIPKEEPKQDLEKEMFELEQELDIPSHLRWHNSKPKQETIEEAAMNYLNRTYNLSYEKTTWQKLHEKTFIAGAKWQQEQNKNLYSEEQVELIAKEMVNWAIDNIGSQNPQSGKKFDEVLNKFKKK